MRIVVGDQLVYLTVIQIRGGDWRRSKIAWSHQLFKGVETVIALGGLRTVAALAGTNEDRRYLTDEADRLGRVALSYSAVRNHGEEGEK